MNLHEKCLTLQNLKRRRKHLFKNLIRQEYSYKISKTHKFQ